MAEFEVQYKGVDVTIYADVYATVYIRTPEGHFYRTDPFEVELGTRGAAPDALVLRLKDLSQLDEIIADANKRGLFVQAETRGEREQRRARLITEEVQDAGDDDIG